MAKRLKDEWKEKQLERKEEREEIEEELEELEAEFEQNDEEMSAPEKPKSKNKTLKRIATVLFVILNVVIIYFIAVDAYSKAKDNVRAIGTFSFTSILFLLGGGLCFLIVLGCETAKYMLMMRHLGEKVSIRHAFSTAALGKYYDCITPSGAGGQPFQIWYLHSKGYSSGASSAMPLSAFFTMQFGFVFLGIVVAIFGNGAPIDISIKLVSYIGIFTYTLAPVMIVITGVAPKLAMRIVAFFVRIGAKLHILKKPNHTLMKSIKGLNNYSRNVKKITSNKKLLIELLLLSLLFQVAMCSMPFFAVHAMGGDMNYFTALALCVFIQAAITLIPTPGNSGAAEGLFYLIFQEFWPMMIWRLMCYYSFIILGALIYAYNAIVKLFEKKKSKDDEKSV